MRNRYSRKVSAKVRDNPLSGWKRSPQVRRSGERLDDQSETPGMSGKQHKSPMYITDAKNVSFPSESMVMNNAVKKSRYLF